MRACLVLVGLTIGCYDDPVRHCPIVDCPQTMVCDNNGGCALKEQVEQCSGQPDGTACSYPGVANGECKAELCVPSGCGNGILTSSEVCDDGNTTNGDGCSADCRSLETCGNAVLDPAAGETCDCGDGTGSAPASCNGLGNSATNSSSPCRENCQLRRCNDGTLEQPEQCEGTNLGDKTCSDLGFYSGTLACSEFCTFDTSGCTGSCGDGTLDAEEEQCDTDEFGILNCQAFGFQTGTLSCNAGCAVDTSSCAGRCGDGDINGTEQCDGSDLGSPTATTCLDVGFYDGVLACNPSCSFDTAGCIGTCGDADKNGPEQCDAADLDGADCTDAGFYGGQLACNPICGFNTSSCVGKCGDNLINGPEQCDGTKLASRTCQSFGFQGGQLTCNANCGFDTSQCIGFCGDGDLNGSEQCDTNDFDGLTCQAFGFYTGELSCTIGCTLFAGACDEFCGDGDKNGPEQCDPGREGQPPDFGTTTCNNIDPDRVVGTGELKCDPRCEGIDASGCAVVKDGRCDADLGETCFNSLDDCDTGETLCCGNGVCNGIETPESCEADCRK
ncbi:MAG: hypothetical protein H0V17_22700 [Deltaproteobacteria bacterium]|nr:hypothetical protein [Deltaproteobacteria bacterium]